MSHMAKDEGVLKHGWWRQVCEVEAVTIMFTKKKEEKRGKAETRFVLSEGKRKEERGTGTEGKNDRSNGAVAALRSAREVR